MKRLLSILFCSAGFAAAQVPAPDFDISIPAFLPPFGMVVSLDVIGPPSTPFGIYYVIGNVFYDPIVQIGELVTGQTDTNGASGLLIPFQTPVHVTVPEAQLAAVFFPTASPPIPTEIVSLSLVAGPPPPPIPPPPPCVPQAGAMTYDPETCTIVVKVKVCPGDAVVLKKNGAVIANSTGPTSGEVVIALGNQCLAPGDSVTLDVNGVQYLGPLRG